MPQNNGNILLIDCFYSSQKYVADAVKFGFIPYILTPYGQTRTTIPLPQQVRFVDGFKDYQKTLQLVKKIKPKFIFAGDEEDVELAMKLQNDLKLPGANKMRYFQELTHKDAMHAALKKAGLRYIRGEVVHNVKEAVAIYKKFKVKAVVLKPSRGAASKGLSFCYSEEEVKKNATQFFKDLEKISIDRSTNGLLIQEKISGIEYIVNTISCNGEHRIGEIWRYSLHETERGHMTFTNAISVNALEVNMTQLTTYVKKMLTALHVENGPVHCELFVDEKGPVLIEINCRLSGGAISMDFADSIYGHHVSDLVFLSLLFPKDFKNWLNYPYYTYQKGYIEVINAPRAFTVKSRPISSILKRLPTIYDIPKKIKTVEKTQDPTCLSSNVGITHLLSADVNAVDRDSAFLEKIEKYFFYLLLEDVDHSKEDIPPMKAVGKTADAIIEDIRSRGLTLVLNDKRGPIGIDYVTTTDLKHVKQDLGNYAFGIINLKQTYQHILRETLVENMLTFMEKIRIGGMIIVSERSCNIFPYGEAGIEVLLKVAGFKIILPEKDGYIYAVKE
ncbi:MAG: ATP-grasp domain-containing protein [Bacilli bacterium]|nr:ATP-grasp domain-containing protein [Bacilli bacterium]